MSAFVPVGVPSERAAEPAQESEGQQEQMDKERGGTGCTLSMLAVNALLIGLLAFSFTQGPYSSREQELWYRYGSLGFFIAGALLPAFVLLLGVIRSRRAMLLLTKWMVAALLTCFVYACVSGGGV